MASRRALKKHCQCLTACLQVSDIPLVNMFANCPSQFSVCTVLEGGDLVACQYRVYLFGRLHM